MTTPFILPNTLLASDASGVCLRCGCKEDDPCDDNGMPCAWTDEEANLCTACLTPAELAEIDQRVTPNLVLSFGPGSKDAS